MEFKDLDIVSQLVFIGMVILAILFILVMVGACYLKFSNCL